MSDPDHVAIGRARNRLALIWFPACGLLFTFLIVQTLLDVYGEDVTQVWDWALPNLLPTLALIASVFAASALNTNERKPILVRKGFLVMTICLSLFYLLTILLVLLMPGIRQIMHGVAATPGARLDAMTNSSIFLGPMQSLVVGALGVLFVAKATQD